MSSRLYTSIVCDGCQMANDYMPGHAVRYIRAESKKDGWLTIRKHGRTEDYCPDCAVSIDKR